jgi:hypothetical protein
MGWFQQAAAKVGFGGVEGTAANNTGTAAATVAGTPTGGFKPLQPGPPGTNFAAVPTIQNIDQLKAYAGKGGDINTNVLASSMPTYQGLTNGNGSLKDAYSYNPTTTSAADFNNLQSYGGLSKIAYGQGPTDMYKAQAGLIDQNTNQQMNAVNTDAARGTAEGFSNLATTGGAESGARERMASSQGLASLGAGQNVYANAMAAKGQAGVADAGMKYDALGKLTGLDTGRVTANTGILNDAKKVNVGTQINDNLNKNTYGLQSWGKLGDIYGSGKVADAQQAAADKKPTGLFGGTGFLGMGIGG